MSRYVIDASVALKWFVPEVHTDEALTYLDDDNELLAPDLLWSEFANILWKKVQLAELTPDEAREVLELSRRTPFHIYRSSDLLTAALEVAIGLKRTVYDSLYLALAVEQNCQMVTADRRLYNEVERSALKNHIVCLGS